MVKGRAALEDVYAAALDDFEERWLGTRSHVAALRWRRQWALLWLSEQVRIAALVQKPGPLVVIASVA